MIEIYLKSRSVYVRAGADVATGPRRWLTWRATEAMWQSPGGPHGAREAHSGAATWQEATRSRSPSGRP